MTLDELMASNSGTWENDVAVVKNGAYFVRAATRKGGEVTLTDEGLRAFPELTITNTKPVKKLTSPVKV